MTGASPSTDAVEELVSFLRSRRDDPQPGDLSTAELLDPDRLAAVVTATAEGRGSADPQVLASLWWQGYTYRLAGTTLAALVVSGAAPDPAAEAGAGVGVTRSRPSSMVVGSHAAELTERSVLIDRLFACNLEPVAAALRARHQIGTRLLWGNAAAAITSCLGAVCAAENASADLAQRAEAVVAALPHGLTNLLCRDEPSGDLRRTTCCLWWKTSDAGGRYCSDCSLR